MTSILNTGINNVKNPSRYIFRDGAIKDLSALINSKRVKHSDFAVIFIDHFFIDNKNFINDLNLDPVDKFFFVSTDNKPTTDYIDELTNQIKTFDSVPCVIVGIGGGSTLDIAKAISNLMTNKGNAENFQGWDLIKYPGIYKIGIPTLSGTGSESTRTCVMTNKKNNLKLGMNSDHTVYDQLIMDPTLTKTVPKDQYFYSGMDSYIHCIESLNGSYRNVVGDSYSNQVKQLCKSIFLSVNMQSDENRSKLMVASYLGGCAIATSYVGLIHPFSAGLSVALGLHHCEANCIAFRALSEFYEDESKEFEEMCLRQNIDLRSSVCSNLNDKTLDLLFQSTIIHEKPLTNALGVDYKKILTKEKVISIFLKM